VDPCRSVLARLVACLALEASGREAVDKKGVLGNFRGGGGAGDLTFFSWHCPREAFTSLVNIMLFVIVRGTGAELAEIQVGLCRATLLRNLAIVGKCESFGAVARAECLSAGDGCLYQVVWWVVQQHIAIGERPAQSQRSFQRSATSLYGRCACFQRNYQASRVRGASFGGVTIISAILRFRRRRLQCLPSLQFRSDRLRSPSRDLQIFAWP